MYTFCDRHIGPSSEETRQMLECLGASNLDELSDRIVPENIRLRKRLNLPPALSEAAVLKRLSELAGRNRIYKNFIGQGYYGTITP
ncbi:MAG: hypothetical protein NZ534_07655, partial [Bacteroidia bacterium]|nr:hypothetical protein [Bacteroidia bacterium]